MANEELRLLIRSIADEQGLRQMSAGVSRFTADAQRAGTQSSGLARGFDLSTGSALKLGGAIAGVGTAAQLGLAALGAFKDLIGQGIGELANSERTARAVAASYGAGAEQFTRFAVALEAQTGFTRNAILEAALSARTLSDNYGLTTEQTQKLIKVSADLARVRGIGVAEAFERVQSAIRGEAEASEYLGLTLNATFLKNNAANGAYKQTYETLSDAQRAQIVYAETLRQSEKFQGWAAEAAKGLDGAMSAASLSTTNLRLELAKIAEPSLVAGFQAAAKQTDALTASITEAIRQHQVLVTALGGNQPTPPAPPKALKIGDVIPESVGNNLAAIVKETQGAVPVVKELGQQFGLTGRIVNESFQRTHTTLAQINDDLAALQSRSGTLSSIVGALAPAGLGDTEIRAQIAALTDLQRIDARVSAQRAAAALELERLREREATKITDPRDAAGARAAQQRLDILDQLVDRERELAGLRDQQADIQQRISAAQGMEAAMVLQILPARQQIAQYEREIAQSADKQLNLRQEMTRLIAQQRALGPNNALDDTQAQIQRDKLLLNVRDLPLEQRQAARREIRDLSRNALPGQELAAFDANRQVTLAERAGNATSLSDQIRQNELQQRQAAVEASIRPQENAIFSAQQSLEWMNQARQVADALVASAQRKLDVAITFSGGIAVAGGGGGALDPNVAGQIVEQAAQRLYAELTEGEGQLQLPPSVQQSGVRR